MSALKKITHEEQGEVYVGVWATPTPPHIPILPSQLTFFSWIQLITSRENGQHAPGHHSGNKTTKRARWYHRARLILRVGFRPPQKFAVYFS